MVCSPCLRPQHVAGGRKSPCTPSRCPGGDRPSINSGISTLKGLSLMEMPPKCMIVNKGTCPPTSEPVNKETVLSTSADDPLPSSSRLPSPAMPPASPSLCPSPLLASLPLVTSPSSHPACALQG